MNPSRPGATPEKPWGRRPYFVQGQSFSNLGTLAEAVGLRRIEYGQDVEFEDPFIAEVVNTMHPDVVRRGYTAIRFRDTSWSFQPPAVRAQLAGFNVFMGYFLPISRWQDISTYPWRRGGPTADLKAALRAKWAMLAKPRPTALDVCTCGSGESLEYDHVSPTFDEIAVACLAFMTAEERATRFGYDKFCPDTISVSDFIPDDHPAVRRLLAQHQQNLWQWLCRACHQAKTAEQLRARARRITVW